MDSTKTSFSLLLRILSSGVRNNYLGEGYFWIGMEKKMKPKDLNEDHEMSYKTQVIYKNVLF